MQEDPIRRILREDPRYARAAYGFVREALHRASGGEGHVSGPVLLAAFREMARERFGPLARAVLDEWGVRSTDDVGAIVFNLVEAEQLGKTDDDDISDFHGVYDFADAFPDDLGPVEIHRAEDDDLDGDDEED